MWLFLRRRILKWAVLVILVPLSAKVAHAVADRLEQRRGPNVWSKGLRAGAGVAGRRKRKHVSDLDLVAQKPARYPATNEYPRPI